MRSIRVYGTIDTVKNMYNDFIILQDVFFLQVIFTFHVEFGITYKVWQFILVPRGEPRYQPEHVL